MRGTQNCAVLLVIAVGAREGFPLGKRPTLARI
jgi:hypothetical protein